MDRFEKLFQILFGGSLILSIWFLIALLAAGVYRSLGGCF